MQLVVVFGVGQTFACAQLALRLRSREFRVCPSERCSGPLGPEGEKVKSCAESGRKR